MQPFVWRVNVVANHIYIDGISSLSTEENVNFSTFMFGDENISPVPNVLPGYVFTAFNNILI